MKNILKENSMFEMSKSNADFSAFDFNDTSDNSDEETPAPFLGRSALNNHNNSNNSNNNKNCRSNGSSSSGNSGNSGKRKNANTHKSNNNVTSKSRSNNNKSKNNEKKYKTRRNNQLTKDCDPLTTSTSTSSNSSSNEEDDGDNDDNGNDELDGKTEMSQMQNQRPLQQQQKQSKRKQLEGPLNDRRHLNESNNCNNSCGVGYVDGKPDADSDGDEESDVDGDDGDEDDDRDCIAREGEGDRHCMSQYNGNGRSSKTQPTHKQNSDVLLMAALSASTTEMNNRRNVDAARTLSHTIQSTTITTTTATTTTATTTSTATITTAAATAETKLNSTTATATTNASSTTATQSNDFSRNSSPMANSIDSNHRTEACSEDDGDGDGDDDADGIGIGVGVIGDGGGGACAGDSQMHNGHSKQIASLLDNGHNNNNNNNSNSNAHLNACSRKNMQNNMNNNSNNNHNDCNELRRSSSSASLSNHSQQTANHAGGLVAGKINIGMNINGIAGGGDGASACLDNAVSRNAPEYVGGNSNGGGSNSNMARIDSSGSLCGAGLTAGTVSASASISSISASNFNGSAERKKYRHQNYSKNIYIGTKNAEKWEHTRTRLHFKNDVEFVVYLLNMAENDTERLANLPSMSVSTTPTKGFDGNFKLEPNLSAKEFVGVSNCSSGGGGDGGDGGGNSQAVENCKDILPTPQAPPVKRKYKKRVQFNDPLNGAVTGKTKTLGNVTGKTKKQMMNNKCNGSGRKHSNNNNDNKNISTNKSSGNGSEMLPEVLDCRIAEKIKSELEEKSASKDSIPNALCLKKADAISFGGVNATGGAIADDDEDDDDDDADAGNSSIIGESLPDNGTINNNQNSNFRTRTKNNKRGPKTMVPPAPCAADNDDDPFFSDDDDGEDDDPLDEEALAKEMKNEQNFVEEEDELDIALRSQQSCKECSLTHDYKVCPLRTAMGTITDAVDLAEWIERKNLEALAKLKADAQRQAKQLHGDDDEDMDESSQLSELETKPLITFAEASVPAEFELHNVEPNVTGVFARTDVRAFSKLGPLIGQSVQSTDIREGSDMKWIFEICEAGAEKSQFLLCDNPNSSNWLRYIRPAPCYDERNVNLVSIESQAFFVTCRDLKNGMELLYWSDDCNTMWRKKHWSDKTNCGGCNLNFDHSLYYRTHCSIFHDPSMSLTIRKYHCKVCGEAVLGRDNILKHAAEKHDGTGAHQCQFCNKFFLRLSYLDVHRTYGCASNPNRCQPICDLCGRKFFRPQKLNNHMKRMHSDMADVLRDFQCKLCSKLLGSRAALQRHAKEVHSRNSTVVSCPRCSKLFQNRSNLKIHMLTHSGVRPFKCSEAECNAAFTTKQCLQFHYKKVHNYTQEQMPKIERSVAYTFDAYSGGMKVDFLEQAPRRRRKSLEDHNSVMSSSLQSDTEFSDDNIFEVIKKSGKSIKDLCRNEPNLSLLSSKISSIFGDKPAPKKRGRKRKDHHLLNDRENEHDHVEQIRRKQNAQLSLVETFLTTTAQRLTAQQQVQQVVAAAAAVSAMANGAADDPNKLHMMPGLQHQHMALTHQHSISSMVQDDEEEDDEEADDEQSHHAHDSVAEQIPHDNSYRHTTGLNALGQNLVVSKGSKKWMSDDDHHISRDCASVDRCALSATPLVSGGVNATLNGSNTGSCSMNQTGDLGLPSFAVPPSASDDSNKLIGNNRDFLSRLINSANSNHNHHVGNTREEDENTSFLDVVESNNNNNNNNSNNNGANGSMSQYHHNNNTNSVNIAGGSNSAGSNSGATNVSTSLTHNSERDSVHGADDQDALNSLTHPQSFMSTFYNNANTRLNNTATASSSSASMLVEAALNSVGNMIDAENNELKVPTENNINTNSPLSSHVDTGEGRFNANSDMDNLESELKMMKNLNNFPMQMPPLPMFPNANNNLNSCNISSNNSTPTNPHSQQNNEVDVDAGSTPRPQHMGGGGGNGSGGGGGAAETDGYVSASQHRTPTSPQPISPGRDYGMFNNHINNGASGGPGTGGSTGSAHSTGGSSNNISASSPLPASIAQVQRRTASTVSSSYPEHELISPASSPSIPRYNFNGDMMRHKHRVEQELDRPQILAVGHNTISSDEENSIMPQNSSAGQDMRMKFSQPHIDLMYSKYESLANSAVLKYNNQSIDSPTEYRNTNSVAATANATNDMSDLQGLDMSSRSNLNASNYHHNFQLPSNTPANLSGIGRYHHHIYDILSEREQNQGNQGQSQQHLQHQQQQEQQQQHHHHHNAAAQHQQQDHSSQLAMQQHQSAMHSMLTDQMNEQEHDQVATVDLSRTANYVVPSPPQLPYNHPHHDMIRMASLDLTPNTNMSVGNNRSFLSSQMQHQSRESLEHHRLLSTVEQHRILAASNAADQHRLLVDPTAHLLMEQNNRLLGSDQSRLLGDTAQNRHMAAARGFGAYHQVASGNYHHSVRPTVLPTANHHASNPSNYHPFPAYY